MCRLRRMFPRRENISKELGRMRKLSRETRPSFVKSRREDVLSCKSHIGPERGIIVDESLTLWFVFRLSICFLNASVHISLHKNLIISNVSVNNGRSLENLACSSVSDHTPFTLLLMLKEPRILYAPLTPISLSKCRRKSLSKSNQRD